MNLRGVFFDFDGTVVHTEQFHQEIIKDVYEEYSGERIDVDESKAYVGIKYFDRFLHILAGRGIDDDQLVQRLEKIASERYSSIADFKSCILPGLPEFLGELKTQGVVLAIVSSATHDRVERRLNEIGLQDYFCHITGSDDVRYIKPHPEPYLWTLKQLGLKTGEVVVFEDSPTGVESAYLAGLPVVGTLTSFFAHELEKAVMTIPDYSNLTVEKINSLLKKDRSE